LGLAGLPRHRSPGLRTLFVIDFGPSRIVYLMEASLIVSQGVSGKKSEANHDVSPLPSGME